MRSVIAVMFVAALGLTGCGVQSGKQDPAGTQGEQTAQESAEETPQQADEDHGSAEFPRTIEVPEGEGVPAQQVQLDSQPERVAALTYETGELVAELGAVDRLVFIQESLSKDILSGFADEMAQVEFQA
ncbi:MAG TPA: hypothetical protein VK054_12085, partial [Beutenbergiaceae bacterium]|nr:hypothetical protein [Beutenbergiaceae bacterium]